MSTLYFVAILPPKDQSDQISELKKYCQTHFASSHALRSPPHVTLHMPFKWKENKRAALDTCLEQVAETTTPFEVQLKNFDYFEPRVVFVDVLPNDKLKALQHRLAQKMRRDLNLYNAEYKDRPFHPHMTIAFRDLKKPKFYEARKHFSTQQIELTFSTQNLALLKHNGSIWEVEKWFEFKG